MAYAAGTLDTSMNTVDREAYSSVFAKYVSSGAFWNTVTKLSQCQLCGHSCDVSACSFDIRAVSPMKMTGARNTTDRAITMHQRMTNANRLSLRRRRRVGVVIEAARGICSSAMLLIAGSPRSG